MKIINNKKYIDALYHKLYTEKYKPHYIIYEFLPNNDSYIYLIYQKYGILYISTYTYYGWSNYTSSLTIDYYKNMTDYCEVYTYSNLEPYLDEYHIKLKSDELIEKL